MFKPHEQCEECDHPFDGCPNCVIVDSAGSREIATIEKRPIGEFDQTPEYWRCNTCETINAFDGEGPVNGFLAPKVSDYMEDMECKNCGGAFSEDSWVVSPFWVYLGTWDGRAVAEGGPWHWSVEWHKSCADESHSKDVCYATRKNGRRRRENPCINKTFAAESAAKRLPIPPILIVDTDHDHSLPPPSAGLTPFPEDQGYDSERETMPEFPPGSYLHPDNQTLGTGGFTIGDYAGDDGMEDAQRGLDVPYDEPDLGSYYDAPPEGEEFPADETALDDYYEDGARSMGDDAQDAQGDELLEPLENGKPPSR